jgi:hypothetical protein
MFFILTDEKFRKLRALVPDGKALRQALQFATVVRRGTMHTHILNDSLYDVTTERHTIAPNESLCGRGRSIFTNTNKEATCPGCVGIARCLVIRDILFR